MTPFKNYSKNPKWHSRLKRGSIYIAVALAMSSQIACNSDNGNDWEEVTTYEVTKGVVTTLEETEPGQFSIIDEQIVEHKDSSRVIIKRLDGSTEMLSLEQARGLVSAQDTVYQTYAPHRHHHGMGGALWWGAMGYMMGRSFNSPVQSYVYRDGSYRSAQTGQTISQELRRTAIPRTEMRPIKGKSGFFRNSSRGRSRG